MTDINKQILDLSNEWHELISEGIHKDRDCHWYIETIWSYGLVPKYFVKHNGYISDDIEIPCSSYEDALIQLRNVLKIVIEREKTPSIEIE